MELKDAIASAYNNRLRKASKADVEVGGKDSAVVVKENMIDFESKDDGLVQAGVPSNED